jgi:hypothetical protein
MPSKTVNRNLKWISVCCCQYCFDFNDNYLAVWLRKGAVTRLRLCGAEPPLAQVLSWRARRHHRKREQWAVWRLPQVFELHYLITPVHSVRSQEVVLLNSVSVVCVAVKRLNFTYCWTVCRLCVWQWNGWTPLTVHHTTNMWPLQYENTSACKLCKCITYVWNLLHVSATLCGHLQGGVLRRTFYSEVTTMYAYMILSLIVWFKIY